MSETLTKREHRVLQVAVVYGWPVEYDRRGRATWDGDYSMPFRAHGTLESLVKKGLMENVCGVMYGRHVRATSAGKDYRCAAHGCQRGNVYGVDDDDCDTVVGKCQACDGTGLANRPRTSTAKGASREQ